MGQNIVLPYMGLCAVVGTQNLFVLDGDDFGNSTLDTREAFDTGRNLLQLDTQTPQFHLIISPAAKENFAVRSPGGNVTGGVDILVGYKGAGNKRLGRKLRIVTVAETHAFTADVQIAAAADRQRIEPLVKDVKPAVAHGTSGSNLVCMGQFLDADTYGCLGGAVLIVNSGICQIFQPLQQFSGEGLAAADQTFHPGHGFAECFVSNECRQTGRCGGQETHCVAGDEGGQPIGRFQIFVSGQDDGLAI